MEKKRKETSTCRVVPLSKGVEGSDKQKVFNADLNFREVERAVKIIT
jgi:hypothetical protein